MLPSGPKSTGPTPRCGELQLAGGARGGSFVPDIAPGARWGKERCDPFPAEAVLQQPPHCSTALGL